VPPSASDPAPRPDAADHPIARVLVDLSPPHLDRPFDYRVPADLDAAAQPGVRVRVRFAGRLVGGFVLERATSSRHPGTLARLDRVVSAEPVLSPAVARLCRAVADHYAGTAADVVRLAVPPRHARTEREAVPGSPPGPPAGPDPAGWTRYPAGPQLLTALGEGRRPHTVLGVLPGTDWADLLARAALAAAAGGRGAIVVVPDTRDVARVDSAIGALVGPGHHVALHGELGPTLRYRAFLAALRGRARVVVGTRSAVFAPVHDLGLVVVWDDGDDLLAEPRAPYPHARDVALLRAHHEAAAVLLAGHARTAEAARLVQTGWAVSVTPDRDVVRRQGPAVRAAGGIGADDQAAARLPHVAFQVARGALTRGPVLVQVPRGGYWPVLACRLCRELARCGRCSGPLRRVEDDPTPACGWCGRPTADWRCPHCGSDHLRAVAVGSERTAEELGRAFPGVVVRQSGWGNVVDTVPAAPALVVATPGAEPVAPGGYAAALLLDAVTMLRRPDLRAAEEALRRWLNAAALVRSSGDGGAVVVVGPSGHRAVQALVRWDPAGFAARELAERESARLPPAVRLAELSGQAEDVSGLLSLTDLPAPADVLGPVPVAGGPEVRLLLRVPLTDGPALTAALHAAAGVRSARRSGGPVRVRLDPADLG
jgi:primosomal protein N' (replication factor Y) (superfamily II helicase)